MAKKKVLVLDANTLSREAMVLRLRRRTNLDVTDYGDIETIPLNYDVYVLHLAQVIDLLPRLRESNPYSEIYIRSGSPTEDVSKMFGSYVDNKLIRNMHQIRSSPDVYSSFEICEWLIKNHGGKNAG